MLASHVFKKMVQPKIKTAQALSGKKFSELTLQLPGDDPNALVILLRMMHGKFKDVPCIVNLRTLANLAVLVKKYGLSEVTCHFSDHWLEHLEGSIPDSLNDSLLPCMAIACVFQRLDILRRLSRVAIVESDSLLEASHLPIPDCLLRKSIGPAKMSRLTFKQGLSMRVGGGDWNIFWTR